MNISISEFKPSSGLQSYIQAYWIAEFNLRANANFSQSVVPSGCIELIIHQTDEHCFLSKNDNNWDKSPAFTLLGLYPKSYDVKFSKKVKTFGIRFYPDGIRNIFGVPPSEFLATYEASIDVLGRDFNDFCARIRDTEVAERQVQLVENYLLKLFSRNSKTYDYTHLAMKLIRQSNGIANYQELTGQIPISLRQLQREFKNQYGLTIKDYMRISRLNAIHQYMQNPNTCLTELAYQLEFTDQSHFIREYKNYVGVPPKKFIKEKDKFLVNAV